MNRAVLRDPRWRNPVGEGAKRVRAGVFDLDALEAAAAAEVEEKRLKRPRIRGGDALSSRTDCDMRFYSREFGGGERFAKNPALTSSHSHFSDGLRVLMEIHDTILLSSHLRCLGR